MEGKTAAGAGRAALKLLVISLPLLLNDFYLMLMPLGQDLLNIVLDLIIYIGWQGSIIYMAYKAGWFTFDDLGLRPKSVVREIMKGLLLLVAVFFVFLALIGLAKLLKGFFGLEIYSKWYFPLPHWHPGLVFLYVFYLSVSAGIFEEIIYRGMAIAILKSVTGRKTVLILVSAMLFTLIHWSMGPMTWTIAFIFGLLWAFLFIKTGSLIPVMVAHFTFDFLTIYHFHELLLEFFGIKIN